MADTIKHTSGSSRKLYNPKYIVITPLVPPTASETEWKKGTTVYFCEDIIADSTSITQEENTENPIENELSSTPIVNRIEAGSYTVSTEIGDMQPDLLEALLGFEVTGTKAYAPDGYVTKYAEFALVFPNEGSSPLTYSAAILPKVQLSPTITIDSLSTSMGRIVLGGTGSLLTVDGHKTPFYVDTNYTLPGTSV